jgi:hypothetical protein
MSPGCLAGTRTTLVNWVLIRGPCQLFSGLITLFQRYSVMNKEGPLRIYEAVPLLSPILWQVATHAPKGPRAHTMSPPWQGYTMGLGTHLLAEQRLHQLRFRDAQMLSYIAEDGTQCANP